MEKKIPQQSLYEFARQSVPCVGFHTRRATRLVTQYYDHVLAPASLRLTQFTLLNTLAVLGEMTMQYLALVLAMDRTTLTRNLGPLLRDELVQVEVGRDHRTRQVSITPAGAAALAAAQPYWEKAQAGIVEKLGAENWDQIMRSLQQISMIVEADLP